MKKDYGLMPKAELELELKRLRDNLEDFEETMQFNFTYSSAHISSQQVRKDEDNLSELKKDISAIEKLLSQE